MTQKIQGKTRILGASSKTISRSYTFTLNNYTQNEINSLLKQFAPAFLFAFQEEIGKNGTPHLQGVVKWKNARSFMSMKKINKRAHWEKCRSIKASILYCIKEDTRNGRIFTFNCDKYIIGTTRKIDFKEWHANFKRILTKKILASYKNNETF